MATEAPLIDEDGYTPKGKAIDIVLGWIRMAHEGETDDLPGDAAFAQEARKHLALIHDTLLDESELDGLPLVEDRMDTEAFEDTMEMLVRVFTRDMATFHKEGVSPHLLIQLAEGWWKGIDPAKL